MEILIKLILIKEDWDVVIAYIILMNVLNAVKCSLYRSESNQLSYMFVFCGHIGHFSKSAKTLEVPKLLLTPKNACCRSYVTVQIARFRGDFIHEYE